MGGHKDAKTSPFDTRTLERKLTPPTGQEGYVLLLLRGKATGRSWPCTDRLTIGRDSRAQVTVTDDSVSRRHAQIQRHTDGEWRVHDLDSRNGVFVNGEPIKSAVLRPGDRIQIGEHCIFKFSRVDALEKQLVEAQKLEAVGRLASGIAHDYNNVLMVISANASYLQESMRLGVSPDVEDVMESITMIKSAADRAADVTRQLLDFARKGTENRDRVDLAAVIQGAIDMASRAVGPNVQIESSIDKRIDVEGAESRLTQILLNLCMNADDAMPDGGALEISLTSMVIDAPTGGATEAIPSGDWAVITVADSGTGIDPEHRDRIFEPFFTTKAVGQGTGLGLPMVYGIVTQHGGHITVSSVPGSGTAFTIYLPKIDHRRSEKVTRTATNPLQSGRVLLVDDDEYVRRATIRLLGAANYEVTEADGGHQAIELFKRDPDSFQFVLLDLVMPEMSGLETYRHLRKISESAIIILCSGGGKNRANVALAEGANGFINKPFGLEDLAAAFADAQMKQFG